MKYITFILFVFAGILQAQDTTSRDLLALKSDALSNMTVAGNAGDFSVLSGTGEVYAKKSVGLGVLYSLLLPGMGELYAGNYGSGKYFTVAEGVLWCFYAGFNIYHDWKKDDYIAFATSAGGVNNAGKDADYYANISEYVNIDDFNRSKSFDRNYDAMYESKQFYWNWQSEANRKAYRALWKSSEEGFNNIRFAVGGMIINRIASAINSMIIIKSNNKKAASNSTVSFNAGISRLAPTMPEFLQFSVKAGL